MATRKQLQRWAESTREACLAFREMAEEDPALWPHDDLCHAGACFGLCITILIYKFAVKEFHDAVNDRRMKEMLVIEAMNSLVLRLNTLMDVDEDEGYWDQWFWGTMDFLNAYYDRQPVIGG